MAWTKEQQQFCEYTICTVESGCDYAAVNMSDPITLGIGQFYAYNAAALMERLRDNASASYDKLSSRLKDAVANHPSDTDATWWTGFYLYQDDADSWVASAQDMENHAVQDQFFMDWVFGSGGAFDTLAGWGMSTDNVKQTIFMLSVYHQAPASANQILANIGGGRSLDDYLNATLNTWPVSGYSNRYNRVYQLLNDWDGTSAPPDFGQSDFTPGTNPDTNGQTKSSISRLEQVGNDLIVYGAMGQGTRLVCHNTGNGVGCPCETQPRRPTQALVAAEVAVVAVTSSKPCGLSGSKTRVHLITPRPLDGWNRTLAVLPIVPPAFGGPQTKPPTASIIGSARPHGQCAIQQLKYVMVFNAI